MKKLIITIAIFTLPLLSHAQVYTNSLAIPNLGIFGKIVNLPTIKGLGNNIWHRPNSSTPDAGGNSVFIAHRIITIPYPMKATFGKLPQTKVGDIVVINWKGIDYKYKVYEIKIVNPEDIEVEYSTKESIITLYTCVYTLTGKLRFVVRGGLIPNVVL